MISSTADLTPILRSLARIILAIVAFLAIVISHPSAVLADPVTVVSTSSNGVYTTSSLDNSGKISALIGRWDTPYPNASTGARAPGLEPSGVSEFYIDLAVNDGGKVSFGYQLRTYDAGIYDWFDISLETPTGTVNLVSKLGKPGSAYGTYYKTPLITKQVDLSPWKNQNVRLIFSVVQDGWGDQSQGIMKNFSVEDCPVPALTELTDPEALDFENGQTINTRSLQPEMQTALACFQSAVNNAGGSFRLNSAYRSPLYQEHLREVWDKWNLLRNDKRTVCSERKAQVRQEFNRHGLLLTQRPGSPSGPHTQGAAIDMNINSTGLSVQRVLDLAGGCNLYRRLPAADPVHFEHK